MRRLAMMLVFAALIGSCSNGSTPASAPAPAPAVQPAALDAPAFEARVSSARGIALVEFYSPT